MKRPLFVAEPLAHWMARPPAVVDCSILASYLWREPQADEAERLMTGLSLQAPVLLKYEIANVARNKLRSGSTPAAARAGVDALADQQLVFHDVDPGVLLDIGARYGLTAYDAAYLWVAERLQAPLATFDARLARAAQQHLNSPQDPAAL